MYFHVIANARSVLTSLEISFPKQYLFLIVKQTYVVCRIKHGRKPYISSIRLLTILTLLFKFANLKVNMCKKTARKEKKNKKETKKVKKRVSSWNPLSESVFRKWFNFVDIFVLVRTTILFYFTHDTKEYLEKLCWICLLQY